MNINNSQFKLFYRPYTSTVNEIKINNLLFDKLNVDNVLNCKESKLRKYYSIELEKDFLAYKFEILLKWIEKNEFYNSTYAIHLNKIIKVLNLRNFFNILEEEYIDQINSLNFQAKRLNKKIIVDFELKNNEYAYFSMENIDIYQINVNNGVKKVLDKNFKLYVSNLGLIATNNIYKIRISYDDSLSFKLTKKGIYWYSKNIDFEFQTFDKYLLYEYIKEMIFIHLKHHKKKTFTWPNGYLNRNNN